MATYIFFDGEEPGSDLCVAVLMPKFTEVEIHQGRPRAASWPTTGT